MFLTFILAAQAAAAPPQFGAPGDPIVTRTGDVVAETWSDVDHLGVVRDWYRLSLDGGATFSRDRLTTYDVKLRYANFDPLRDAAPSVPEELAAPADGNRLWIVQTVTQGTEPWRDWLRARGAVDHRFLGMHANIWEMDEALAEEAAAQDFVRWVGPFHPAYKLENELMTAWLDGTLFTRRYNIVVGEWGMGQKAGLVDALRAMDAVVHEVDENGWIVPATLTPAQLVAVVGDMRVLGVDRWSAPETDMDKARALMGANYVETVAGYTGQGVRGEVMDSGLDTTHADWSVPPLLHTSTSAASHGTCTYGINFASGASTSGGQTRGVIPDAVGIFANYSNFGSRYTHTAELVNPALQWKAVFQSNSWGGSRTTQYTSTSQEMDDIIYLNDISILQSQSNSGWQDSRPQAWAKNIISVGGIRHYNTQSESDDAWAGGASIGPAADGRIKPDIAAWYDSVWTSDNDPGGYASGDDYTGFNGTSAATPIVAGHVGLIYQMWADGIFGNTVGGGTVFDERPANTTAKALLLNSSHQWTFSGAGADLTRTHQGWGRPDVQRLYDNASLTFVDDEETPLTNLGVTTWDVVVPAGQPEFRATLVYTDRAGTTSSNLHRINDLSMRVTAPGGAVYWGNNGLTSAMTSASGGFSNTKDTVEQVIVANPTAGTWKVDIFADEVNQDTRPSTPQVDADFALVVTPVSSATGGETSNKMSLTGVTTPVAGLIYSYQYAGAEPNAPVWLLGSPNTNGTVYSGHDFDLGAPVSVLRTTTAPAAGAGNFLVQIPAGVSGSTYYFEVASLFAGEWTDSAALRLDIQ
ncbi:MAG: S8 family serine peptidase [Planctomycetota bacterium]|jgi:hypothetical protein